MPYQGTSQGYTLPDEVQIKFMEDVMSKTTYTVIAINPNDERDIITCGHKHRTEGAAGDCYDKCCQLGSPYTRGKWGKFSDMKCEIAENFIR